MLDWEEKVFLGLKAVYHRLKVRPRQRQREAVRATLREQRAALLLLAQMVAGRPLSIFETDQPALGNGDRIFLPREFAAAPDAEGNAAFYLVKSVLAGLAMRRGQEGASPESLAQSCQGEFPELAERIAELANHLPQGLWPLLAPLQQNAGTSEAAADALEDKRPEDSAGTVTEIEGKSQANVEVTLKPDDDGHGADLPIHTFEKVETLDEANGLSRKTDDEDELEDHAEALDQLDMRQLWRSAERPRSIYRSDLILDGLSLEVKEAGRPAGQPYPEWDWKRREYRSDWCFVQPEQLTGGDPAWASAAQTRHRGLVARLRREFAAIVSEWQKLHRQPAGSEFDIDAVIHSEVQRRTGHTPSEAIYLDRRRDLHDVAALILMDQSYSTDSWIDNRRVLDTITSTLFCTGEVLSEFVDCFAVAAFSSHTRNACSFATIKDFDDPWTTARSRFGSLEARGYTRIGPALRHAQELLTHQPARRKLIILITDGRPCDYDRYEGEYGIHDVKKAIETGTQHGITTHAFAIEKQAAEYFPRMFTRGKFDIIPRPEALTRKLCALFARTLAG